MSWIKAPIATLAKTIGGGTPSKANAAYWSGDIPWVSPKDMSDRDIHDAADHITADAVSASATQLVPAGSVLIVVRSGILVRRLPVAVARVSVALNQDMKALICSDEILPDYLAYFLEAKEPQILQTCVKKGATVHSIAMSRFSSLSVPLPTKKEQARIVEILDEAARLRMLRRDADARAALILPALFIKMFGDPATNPKRWPVQTLGQALLATDYGTSTKASDDGIGLPLIRMGNVDYAGNLQLENLKYVELSDSEASRFRLEQGDILFNRTNSKDLVGKSGLWDAQLDAVLASYFIRVRVDREQIEPMFLWALLNSAHMKRVLYNTARGAIGQANINTVELRALPMYKPPLDAQVAFVDSARAIRSALPSRSEANDLDELYKVLLQRAFSGQLTAKWRNAHLSELMAEMELQRTTLNVPLPEGVLS